MSPNETARHIMRNYETTELRDAISDSIRDAMMVATENAAMLAEKNGNHMLAVIIRKRNRELWND